MEDIHASPISSHGSETRGLKLDRIIVVVASFNRKETTLRCLKSLLQQNGAGTTWFLDVVLLDDASTDGTRQAIAREFPQVSLLQGNGNLFWGGGMHRAMTEAIKRDPDYVLMLNDDVDLRSDAIETALADHRTMSARIGDPRQVIIGAVNDSNTGLMTYSGFKRTSRRDPSKLERISPSSDQCLFCDTMNGNFVLIPRSVHKMVGAVDSAFIHQLGDIDYGYRVRAVGGKLWLARGFVGSCRANLRKMPFEKTGLSFAERWRAINSPLGLPISSWSRFMWRWGGSYGLWRLAGIYMLRISGR